MRTRDCWSVQERRIISMHRCLHLCECLWPFFLKNIHTLHSPVYLCWPLGCLGVLSSPDNTNVCNINCLSTKTHHTVHACFMAVTVRHEPSQIVAVCANFATRLGWSRSANFLRVLVHMTSGVMFGTVGDNL